MVYFFWVSRRCLSPPIAGNACILPLPVSLPQHEGMVEALAPAAELDETAVVEQAVAHRGSGGCAHARDGPRHDRPGAAPVADADAARTAPDGRARDSGCPAGRQNTVRTNFYDCDSRETISLIDWSHVNQPDMLNIATCVATVVSASAGIAAAIAALYISQQAAVPQVVVYLDSDNDHSCVYLVVKKIGNGVARNIRLAGFDYSLATSSDRAHLRKRSFVASGIPYLVPIALRKTIVLVGGKKKGREDLCIPVTVPIAGAGSLENL